MLTEYLAHRHRPVTSPNLVMEQPAFLAELGDVAGQRVLDLGCGDGRFADTCRAAGCASYLGVDGAEAMIAEATNRETETREAAASGPTVDDVRFQARFELADLEDYEPAPGAFDVVTSRMALHYVADLGPVLRAAHRALTPSGGW